MLARLLCVAALATAGLYAAATMTFDPTVFTGDPIDLQVVFSQDVSGGKITATSSVVNPPPDGDIQAIWFLVNGVNQAQAIAVQPNFGEFNPSSGAVAYAWPSNNLGNGDNLSGGNPNPPLPSQFTFAVQFANQGLGTNSDGVVIFTITNPGFDVDQIEAVALRVQSVNQTANVPGGGSSKLYDVSGVYNPGGGDPPRVPEPSTYALMGGGLAALALLKRKFHQ